MAPLFLPPTEDGLAKKVRNRLEKKYLFSTFAVRYETKTTNDHFHTLGGIVSSGH